MKRNLILIFCVLLGLSWYTAISDAVNNPKIIAGHLAKAGELEEKGIYVDAIAEYEAALEYLPNDTEISLKMANAYLQTGNSKKFINICKDTAAANQEDPAAMDCLMEYYVEKNNEPSAVKYLNEFTEEYPKNETARKWLVQLKGSYRELFCNYEELGAIHNNSMVVRKEDKYGLADSQGAEILAAEYDEIHCFSEDGLALAVKEGKRFYVDRDGQTRLVADDAYTNLRMMSSGRTSAEKDGEYGYLDEGLEPATDFLWDDLTLISDSVGACRLDGKWALVSKNGKLKTEYLYEDIIRDENGFCSGQKRIFVKEEGRYHLVDKKGEAVGELTFEDARCFSKEGYAAVCMDGKWGYVNAKGELEIECQYDDAQSFRNGFAPVCVDGKWGYIDEYNNLVIEPQFEAATPISETGTAAVKQEKWKLIQMNIFM